MPARLLIWCILCCSVAESHSPTKYIYVEIDTPLPILGYGSLLLTIAENPLNSGDVGSLQAIDTRLFHAIFTLVQTRENLSLTACYDAGVTPALESKFLCSCALPDTRQSSAILLFSAKDHGRVGETCDNSCAICSQIRTRCAVCAEGFFPLHSLPGLCTQKCDQSCAECQHSSLYCTACAPGYRPHTSLPGYCTPHCHESCQQCTDDSAVECFVCAEGYFPTLTLPGQCTKHCSKSCATCNESSIWCLQCAINYFPEIDLPGVCVNYCDPSCRKCHLSAVSCDSCARGFHPSSDLPGPCVRARD